MQLLMKHTFFGNFHCFPKQICKHGSSRLQSGIPDLVKIRNTIPGLTSVLTIQVRREEVYLSLYKQKFTTFPLLGFGWMDLRI
jgi:hypothetical protein